MLDELNEEQKDAVTSTEGFVRVIAGAGSGKTRALTNRFAYLVNEIGILPGNILCVTFTNKAANEMRSRIRMLTGDNDTGYISTFHGFCVSVLQEDSNAVLYPKSFLVLDNADIDSMLQTIYDERGLTLRNMTFSAARDMIEIRKIFNEPAYYLDMISLSLEEIHRKYLEAKKSDDIIFYGYLYQEKKCFGLDYNDLLKFTLHIFKTDEKIHRKWQERLEYIMIDEFQDIDSIQYELMEALCGYHGNLFIVGDPDQTIYTWRGANVKYLIDFETNYPDVKTVMMMKNYRSTPEIIDAANSLAEKNSHRIKKNLIATLPASGFRPVYFHAKSAEEESLFIAEKILELEKSGTKLSDIAILYRAHYVSRNIEEIFQKKKIPYTLFSGVPFFSRAEIKDSISYMRMIAYRDDLSFMRIINVPKRNIGERRIRLLKEFSESNSMSLYEALKMNVDTELFSNTGAADFISLIEKYGPLHSTMQISELFSFVMNESGYEKSLRTEGNQERLDNLAELKQSIYEYENSCGEECSLENYLAHAALYTNSDMSSTKNAVRLMTVHSAKGLEFPTVFLCGMNENIFPSKKTDNQAAMEEERRLAFVAVTRAQEKLFITEAEGQNHGDGFRFPSRFIFDIGREKLNVVSEPPENITRRARLYIKNSEDDLKKLAEIGRLEIGDSVNHAILGKGKVLEIDSQSKTYTIQFEGLATPRKISFKAPIKKTQD
ncbi:MAG: UvrD-helicase domain-containing protein [Treponema sp.]|nr:UvrD-helicase domain-containing protein [Treponema sp.]